MPQFLSDERDEGVQQAQQHLQDAQQGLQGAALARRACAGVVQGVFGQLHIPVAILVPSELVQGLGSQVESVIGEALRCLFDGQGQPGVDPAFRQAQGLRPVPQGRGVGVRVHQRVAGGVPELVAEVAVALQAARVKTNVAPLGGELREGEAQ